MAEILAAEVPTMPTDIVALAGLALTVLAFALTMFELRATRLKLELVKRSAEGEYERGFADGYDAAHEEHADARAAEQKPE
jgi:hypothetical protein